MSGFSLGKVGVIVTAKAPSKSSTPERPMKGVFSLAALDRVMASIKTVRDRIKTNVECEATEYFLTAGCERKARPENFRGIENGASAGIELRKRGTNSPLSPEEVTLCDEIGIAHEPLAKTVEAFVINPSYNTDAKVMKALETVIGAAMKAGKLPADIIQKQQGVSSEVIAEGAMEALFASGDADRIRHAMSICGIMAVGKTKLDASLDVALKEVVTVMDDPAFRKLAEAPAEPEKKGGSKKKAA